MGLGGTSFVGKAWLPVRGTLSFEMTAMIANRRQIRASMHWKTAAIPEAGGGSPKIGWNSVGSVQQFYDLGRKINKNKGRAQIEQGRGLARSVHYTKTWTHSDRRLSQVRERGGRGLLEDECWSFPPASEREARMDDPTRRSKKGRQWNASL